jgi:UDP-N-acetylmuramate dehydrogenase
MTPPTDILERPMRAKGDIAGELAERVSPATVIRRDEPLAGHTTLRVGGPADVYVEPASEADLAAVVNFCNARGVPFFVTAVFAEQSFACRTRTSAGLKF